MNITIGLVFSILMGSFSFVKAAEAPLNMGILPRFRVAETVEYFKPLAEYLSLKLGREVKLLPAKDFPSFWDSISNLEFDLVQLNQYQYVRSAKEIGYRVIAKNEEDGESSLAGAVVVRKDSPLRTLADLKGKKILFGGDTHAMMAYIVPSYLFKQAGLLPGRDYEEDFAKNPSVAVIAVGQSFAVAAGAGESVLRGPSVTKHTDPNKLRVLARSEPIAQIPWAVKPALDPALETRIRASLIELHNSEEGRTILKAARLTAIRSADDADYHLSRKIIKEVLAEEY